MATLAIRTLSGVVTEHPYEKGLAYDAVVAAEKTQEALGWKGRIFYADGALHFTLEDRAKHLLLPEKTTVYFTRPTRSGIDFSKVLTGETTPISVPVKGLWHVRVEAVYKGVTYQLSQRIVIE